MKRMEGIGKRKVRGEEGKMAMGEEGKMGKI